MENSTLKSDLLVQAHGARVDLADTQVEGEAVLSGDRASLSLGGSTQVAALTAEGADGSVAVGKDAAVGDLTAKSNLAVDTRAPSTGPISRPAAWSSTATGPAASPWPTA